MVEYYRQLQQQGRRLRARFSESVVFLRRFVGAPRQVGSIMPSSPYLTRAVLDRVDWEEAQAVAELGAGTGVFTRSIVRRAKPGTRVLVFEIDPALQAVIHREYPELHIYGDAQKLCEIVRAQELGSLDCVVSSLPFTVLPHSITENILDAVQDALKPGGNFVAYQYSKIMKPVFERRFKSVKTLFVPINVPPAFVYDCQGDARKPLA